MEYFDIETACREGFGERKIASMIQQRIDSLSWDLDQNEQEFLISYAYQDLRYYLLYRLGLINANDENASFELCKMIFKNEEFITRIVDEWFNWWVVKWRQRVRLVFNENEQKETSENLSTMVNIDDVLNNVPKKLIERLRKEIVIELMKQNEICSLDVVSDFILRTAFSEAINEYGKDEFLKLLTTNITKIRLRILRKIMEIKDSKQPLVILRIRINPSQPYQGTP